MESLQSKRFKVLLKLVRRKQFWSKSGEALLKGIAKRRKLDFTPPDSIVESLEMSLHEEAGHHYYVINKTAATNPTHVLYLHGGGYVHRITKYHWDFLKRLSLELQCTITIPLYPLAPEHTYKETFDLILPMYQKIERISGAENIVLMGDSAGGGLAFALLQLLKQDAISLPKQTVMISPWLDLTLENPEIDEVDSIDPFLAKPGLVEIGKMYAGTLNRRSFLLSPIQGDLKGLGNISMFMGTHDLLVADARKLVNKMEKEKSPILYYEYPNMIHAFPLFNFPEAKNALTQIVELIEK